MPIRWRLTIYFSLILGVILGLSGVISYILLQRNLTTQIDDVLKAYSAEIHGTLDREEISEPTNHNALHSTIPQINEFAFPGTYIQVIDRDGYVVAKSGSLGVQELPVNPSLINQGFAGNAAIQTVAAGDDARLRIMVSPIYVGDQILLLEVAQSSNYIDSTMNQARWVFIVSVSVALVLSMILGGTTVRGALSPVRQVTQTARNIEEGQDLSRRVGYSGPMDEIGQLASTFDHMIERLDKVFKSQKHFVADASHELRSPLTVIRGNLDLLKHSLSKPDRQKSLQAIESETARMISLVNNLLFIAEAESTTLTEQETVHLEGVVREELKRARVLAGSRKILIRRVEDLTVPGDSQRLRQLLGNLLDNAIRHTPDDGTISVSLVQDGEWARLEVEDTGVGIATEHLSYVFDRFYRVDKARSRYRGSAGLGLAIVKQIAEQHQGKVAVRSEVGKGSTFTVWLKL